MTHRSTTRRLTACLAFLLLFAPLGWLLAEDPAPAPAVSAFAPAPDLVSQVQLFLTDFDAALADEAAYADKKDTVSRDAHTLATLAVALGLHDTSNELQASAPALLKAAQELATAADYAAAKEALAAVKQAVAGEATDGPSLTWNEKVASLGRLMKQVNNVNIRLRRGVRRLDPNKADENARFAAVLGVIAQSAAIDTHEVPDRARDPEWVQYCHDMRDAAGEVNAAIRAADKEAVAAGMTKLTQSCEACHAAFRIETTE
jgi:hypothetical protein